MSDGSSPHGYGDTSRPPAEPSYGRPTFGRPPAQHGQGGQGGQEPDEGARRPSQAKAWWALGLALVPFALSWVVATGLAVAVLLQSRWGPDPGRVKALVALGIVAVWVVVTVVSIIR